MFTNGFTKISFLKQKHVEDTLGMHLDKKYKKQVDQLIAKEKQERVGLRHPWLTGIPTLGIWPSISRANASEEVAAELLRNNPKLRKALEASSDKAHKREVELMAKHIAEREALARENMMRTGVGGALSAMSMYRDRDREQED